MLATSHVAFGWCTGLAAARLLGLHGAETVIPFAASTAGWALAPDLDHPGAKISRSLGPFTAIPSRMVRWLSARVYQATRGPRDENWSGKHRHLTHTGITGAILGLLAWWVAASGGPWAAGAVMAVGMLLAVDGLGKGSISNWLVLALLGVGLLQWTTVGPLGALTGAEGWIGWAVFLGCIAHDWADSFTLAGCPWAFPIPWKGERWYEIRFLGRFSFRTGGKVEKLAVFPILVVVGVLFAPGVWPVVWQLAEQIGRHMGR